MPQFAVRKALSLGIRVMFVAGTAAVSVAADFTSSPISSESTAICIAPPMY
jgi:hypothetical protein